MKNIIVKYLLLISLLFFINCSSINERAFQFTYQVKLAPTSGEKLELWIPIPQTNEVQKISNLSVATINSQLDSLFYIVKREKKHGNSYLYLISKDGIDSLTTITLKFDVNRYEHSQTAYNDVDFCSNGIKIREDNGDLNGSGNNIIYAAFAEAPFVNSNGVPCNAR